MKPTRILTLTALSPLFGPFMLLMQVVAPLIIVLTTLLLALSDAVAVVFVASYALCWVGFTVWAGFLIACPDGTPVSLRGAFGSIPAALRGLFFYSWPLRERRAFVLIGLLAPVAFLASMEFLGFNGVIRWLIAIAVTSTIAGLVTGLAAAAQVDEAEELFPLDDAA